ncbi:MAG: amidotransferase, partial [Chlamydiota bacterium]|nr:amidotransferase [Chlamydiota bacterium]
MRIHYFQHVAFEKPANIAAWAIERHFTLSATHLYENSHMPDVSSFDMLILLGGPMGVGDIQQYPWLVEEKKFISSAIQ